ncbi:MAG TPA: beta-glucanase [Gammaproteobacteria bacterium]|mgnify:CR=1 FL=1|jgi:beta-glucanase (GH16 family)|nr:beta-glucanase [Gammaproteobacteria bacterium]
MKKIVIACLSLSLLLLQGCGSQTNQSSISSHVSNVVWATNIGGPGYTGDDEIIYDADQFESTAVKGQIENIKGAQDNTVYQTYRAGDMHLQHALPNGTYDITFRFAEPDDIPFGARVFDVLVEGQVVIPNLDVRVARDGNPRSSVDRTVLNADVVDGVLDIQFNAKAGEPILSAIVVQTKPIAPLAGWNLVWSDEFDYQGAPDPDKWTHDIWPAEKVNDEEQEYTDDLKNVRVENGNLVIEAIVNEGNITSGRIHSMGKGDLLYGRVEARAKLPEGQGTWPAIWMLPSDPFKYASNCGAGTDWQGSDDCDAWPNSGEIDIMEHVGYDMNRVHGTVHTKAYYWVNGEQRKASIEAPAVNEGFNVYAMEWSAERIDVFLNNTLYFTYLKDSDDWQAWPFDHPFHVILNIAVGGGWGSAGGPTDLNAFPAKMEVDYVRIYKREGE